MRTTAVFGLLFVGLLFAIPACSSSGSTAASSDPSKPGDPGAQADASDPGVTTDGGGQTDGNKPSDPVTCLSKTWCGSGKVTKWNGQTLPTARGGTIADGLYREAYILAEKGTGTGFGDYGSAYLFRGAGVRELGGLARVGTYTTTSSTLSLAYTANCDDQSGATGSASTSTSEMEYLVDAQGRLVLFFASTGSDGNQTVAYVYEPQTTLCGNLPTSVPTEPGDSYVCKVTNCGCTEATNGPSDADTCKFVNGG